MPPHLVQDPLERNVPGFNLGRDPERTPLPWSSEPHGGFTDGQLWLPLNADAERDEPHQSTRRYTGALETSSLPMSQTVWSVFAFARCRCQLG